MHHWHTSVPQKYVCGFKKREKLKSVNNQSTFKPALQKMFYLVWGKKIWTIQSALIFSTVVTKKIIYNLLKNLKKIWNIQICTWTTCFKRRPLCIYSIKRPVLPEYGQKHKPSKLQVPPCSKQMFTFQFSKTSRDRNVISGSISWNSLNLSSTQCLLHCVLQSYLFI